MNKGLNPWVESQRQLASAAISCEKTVTANWNDVAALRRYQELSI